MIRLNKYIAECGVCSRRSADTLIQSGKVSVNAEVITDLGVKIDEISDTIAVDNKIIKKEDKLVYIMLNKPKGYVTTSKEQFGRKSVLDLIDTNLRVYPIGRLDMYTEGLLLLTNDGNFANEMMHPKNKVKKTYVVKVSGNVTDDKIERLKKGVDIGGYITKPAQIRKRQNKDEIEIIISEGKNRQVRKMCDAVGLKVLNLKRIKIGNINLGNLKKGDFRFLTKNEILKLKNSTK